MNSLWTRVAAPAFAASIALSSLVTAAAPPAHASTPSSEATPSAPPASDDVSWSVRPSDGDGPDDRSWVEWEADPGQTRTEHLVVSNYGDREVEFRLSAADGYFTDTGRFNMLPSDRESVDAGTWITLPQSVSVPAGGSEIVPFEIIVPQDSTPGDHPAGVAASILSTGSGTVGVESRVGFRVMTRVTGELRAEFVTAVSGGFTGSINPFQAGALDVAYDITNTGNTRVRTSPVVSIAGPFGMASTEETGDEILDIAPGETRSGTVRVSSAWPLGWYDVSVSATPTAVTDALSVESAETSTARGSVGALPISQLAALVTALGLLTWYLWQRRRARAKTALLIEQARAEGRSQTPLDAPEPAEPVPGTTVEPEDRPRLRRHSRPAGQVLAALLIGSAATIGGLTLGTSDAFAAASESDSGIEVDVEISPLPSQSPTPSPTAPSQSPTPSVSPTSTNPLPPTGGSIDVAALLIGGGMLAAGAGAAVAYRRGPSRAR